jgi:hypothetical protein
MLVIRASSRKGYSCPRRVQPGRGAARPLAPSADIGPGGQSVGQATQFCLVVEHVVGGEMQPSRAIDPKPPGIGIDAAAQRGIGPEVNNDLAGFFGTGRSARIGDESLGPRLNRLAHVDSHRPCLCRDHRGHPGQWSGNCFGLDIYSTAWSEDRIAEHYRDLMERQVVIELAGGVAEAIYRSERRKEEVLRFAIRHCCIGTDLKRARAAR